jgi:membrane protease subunit HflK
MPWGDDKNGLNGGPWGNKPQKNNKPQPPSQDELDELLKKGQERIKSLFSGGGKKTPGGGSKGGYIVLAIIALLVWLASGVYTVNTKEEGVVLRFGKYIKTAGPGLNYHLPSPIEKVFKIPVTERYKEEVGYRSSNYSRRGGDREILMLTGDENIIDINFEVQWQISDARKFLFNINDPQKTIRDAAESAMREVIGTTPISAVLSEGRSVAQLQTKQLLQETLDSYDAGVEIKEINMKGVPPSTVVEAFKDVQAAKINKQETINKAKAYYNEVIPIARGDAEAMLQEAEGYKQQVIADAEGQAERFLQVYNKYKYAKYVTKKRMYLETMEELLTDMDKMIVDDKIGGVVPYLPLNDLNRKAKAQ